MTKRIKRPRDPIALAKLIGDIATGQIGEVTEGPLTVRAKKGGKAGGPARASALTPSKRSEIARLAATVRWKKS